MAKLRDLLLIALLILPTIATSKIISMAAGKVRDHVLTSREVQIGNGLEQLLQATSPEKIKITADIDSPEFAKLVTAALLEWVVFYEAENMTVAQVAPGEIQALEAKIKSVLAKLPAWQALQPSAKELNQAIARKLRAKKFISFRADSSVIPVTDAEALRYFEQNRIKFGNLPFEKFRAEIKTVLARQQVESRLKDWFEVLQNKYQVRNFLAEK
jgi:hypothetical protein